MAKREACTFRVVDEAGRTINYVHIAESERPGDTLEIQIAKRLEKANKLRNGWASDYFKNDKLSVIPCDAQGRPIK